MTSQEPAAGIIDKGEAYSSFALEVLPAFTEREYSNLIVMSNCRIYNCRHQYECERRSLVVAS
jgi:hypothetical protein